MKFKIVLLACVLAACIAPFSAQAQLVREDGVKSIAGILVPGSQQVAEWSFTSSGGEILFATLDAEIYAKRSGEHEAALTAAGESGGCEGGSMPGLFYLEVADRSGTIICHAGRPSPPPGWMLDPRMACKLPLTQQQTTYTLRAGLNSTAEQLQPYYAFLLNVSLRGIAPSGINLQSATALSSTGGF